MYADLELKMQYMNPRAEQTHKRLVAHLPNKVDQMIGKSIDIFHEALEHQRRILADPLNLPCTAMINVGPELFEVNTGWGSLSSRTKSAS
jgi:methyl-accepting chemotaxis protein